ncbi:transposase [Nesterenkonia sp. AN1]|uniref:hypothetical protein n=1 Tax=Nesterenkonia sp. AN1 TaxID=652017 RepID=UPI00044C4816|nr:hypothetical protein [Nesterenkonia sp. AN1]EXF25344.1 transposase [Nesterenkonia sp. AN1]
MVAGTDEAAMIVPMLARRWLDTLYAMLRDGTLYQDLALPVASEHALSASRKP